MKKQNKKTKKRSLERKNLSIQNNGDTVVIKNRSTTSAGVLGALVLLICIIGAIALRDAWRLPAFWLLFGVIVISTVWSVVGMILGKIVLDSPNKTMTVYNPIKKQYKFEDINYVDTKTAKGNDGAEVYKVIVYLGKGKKSVEIASYSLDQANEVASLLRGMLDNGAMEYPEGNEEPFDLEEKEKKPLFPRLKKSSKPDEKPDEKPEEETEEKPDETPEEADKDKEEVKIDE